ncbi:hypothetical protein RCL_jg20052.t1 [Rhizophagus clarus]|uniref:Uncharacterized protein n=1 Tax=Rhizophagus clarus TaxID=94130 RepID=A0A8H3LCD3_9GLOM|nr:hypothetical protein RCL_jg20052.t1 [Rhizophagus clarus]
MLLMHEYMMISSVWALINYCFYEHDIQYDEKSKLKRLINYNIYVIYSKFCQGFSEIPRSGTLSNYFEPFFKKHRSL